MTGRSNDNGLPDGKSEQQGKVLAWYRRPWLLPLLVLVPFALDLLVFLCTDTLVLANVVIATLASLVAALYALVTEKTALAAVQGVIMAVVIPTFAAHLATSPQSLDAAHPSGDASYVSLDEFGKRDPTIVNLALYDSSLREVEFVPVSIALVSDTRFEGGTGRPMRAERTRECGLTPRPARAW